MADVPETSDARDDATAGVEPQSAHNAQHVADRMGLIEVVEHGADVPSDDAEESEQPHQVEAAAEEHDEEDDDASLDVVVTGVEADQSQSAASVVGAALLLGAQPHVVELVVTRARGSYCIRRELSAFLGAITAALPDGAKADQEKNSKCPEFPSKHARSDAALAQWCGDVTQFLADRASELRAAPEWVRLVAESSVASAQSRAHMTAIEFILQPFPYEKIYVPRGSRHEVVLQVKKDDQFLVWRFEIDDHDIDLTVHFLPNPSRRGPRRQDIETDPSSGEVVLQTIHPTTRYVAASGQRPVEGMYECAGPGTATLVWDNSYSRLRGKYVQYQAQVVHKSIMESAVAAADAYDEAIQAKIQREELIRSSKKNQLNTQLVVSPRAGSSDPALATEALSSSSSYLLDTSAHLYRQLFADKLPAQSWLVSAPMNVAGKLASRLFGSPQADDQSEQQGTQNVSNEEPKGEDEHMRSDTDGREAKSLLEELNGLNMQLLERLESCEDKIAHLTVERDQERSRAHLIQVENENLVANLASKDLDLLAVKNDLSRIERERGAWREIQQERDALLEEKHRWAMTDDDVADDSAENGRSDLDSETKNNLEQELGQAEANVLRLRAELGYSLSNHLTGTSTRLEKIAREMTASKRQYEDQMRESEEEVSQLKQQIVKYRSQKRVLIAEIKNIQNQSESQVAVAMAEANEARMVNKRLKKQNELLLTQIRSLVDDAREQEKKLQDQVEEKIKEAQLALHRLHTAETHPNDEEAQEMEDISDESTFALPTPSPEREISEIEVKAFSTAATEESEAESTVPYTLSADDIALLNGQRTPTPPRAAVRPSPAPTSSWSTSAHYATQSSSNAAPSVVGNPHRARLVAFFQSKDPSMLPEVDSMLESYAGVESMLFESLELKYNFMELNELDQ